MSEVLPLISVEAADEILAAQIGVFQLAAKHTETPIDDQALALAQSNAEVRQWILERLGLSHEELGQLRVESVPVGVIAAAQAAGISWLDIVSLLVKYGPQLKQAMALLQQLVELFKGITATPSVPSVPVTPNF